MNQDRPTPAPAPDPLPETLRALAAFDWAHAPSPLPSPCSNVCRLRPDTGLCAGCLRNRSEIAGWSKADDAARRQIWQAIGQRARQLLAAG